METQFQETKELLEVAQKEMEQLRASDNEKIENLTADSEKLKVGFWSQACLFLAYCIDV